MIDKQNIKFVFNKKTVITIIVIFVLLFALLIFIDISINPYPPKVIFIDRETNDLLDGKVSLDKVYLGEIKDGEFTDLPDNFCKKEHTIDLEVVGKQYSWQSFPSDCDLNYIIFKVEEKAIEKESVELRFFIKETQQPLNGTLYFDNELIENINGSYSVDMETCNSVGSIKLESSKGDMEWKHHSFWCENYDIIDYSISESELE